MKHMEKNDVKIPKYVVHSVAKKLKCFIEDTEANFKFYPWQTSSTLSKIRKTIHASLPERAVHYLRDTGTAEELLRFSRNKSNSDLTKRLIDYFYDYLGITILQQKSNNGKTTVEYKLQNKKRKHPSSCVTNNTNEILLKNSDKVFEIKKLVETVAQELILAYSFTTENNPSTLYNLKLGKYYLKIEKKQQKLACCTSPACLHYNKENILKQNRKQTKISKKYLNNVRNWPMKGSHLQTNKSRHIFGRASVTQKANKQQHSKRFRQPIELKQTRSKRTVENATQTSPWRQRRSLSVSSQQETALEFEESSSLDSDINCKSDTLNDASMITEEIASEYAQDNHGNQNPPSREASRRQSAVKSLDIGARVVKFLSQKAEQNTENKEADDVPQTHLISVNSSRFVTECSKEVSDSCLKSDNPDQSCQGLSLKASSRSSLKSEHKIPSKTSDRSRKTSKSSRVSKSQSINYVVSKEKTLEHSNNVLTADKCGEDMALSAEEKFHEKISIETKLLKESPKKICNTKCLNNIHIERSECLENAKSEDIPESQKETPNIQQKKSECVGNINDSQKEIQSSSTPTSSENETTQVPMDSSSSSKMSEAEDESEYSSIKENDNTSPDYSSHWTEEITSEELSEEELDNSFREKFTVYKKSLLEEDDGIVASDEDEISIYENETLETVHGKDFDRKRYAQSVLEKEDIEQFKQLIESEKNFLNYENEDGFNLLHLTASKGLDNFVKALLQVGFPLEAVTKKGLTALKLAIFNGHTKCCNVLLQNGASLTKENGDFDTGIFEFSGEIHPTMKILLEEYGENLNKVQKLCEILNKTGNKKKKMSKKLSQNLLCALADLTFDEDSLQD